MSWTHRYHEDARYVVQPGDVVIDIEDETLLEVVEVSPIHTSEGSGQGNWQLCRCEPSAVDLADMPRDEADRLYREASRVYPLGT